LDAQANPTSSGVLLGHDALQRFRRAWGGISRAGNQNGGHHAAVVAFGCHRRRHRCGDRDRRRGRPAGLAGAGTTDPAGGGSPTTGGAGTTATLGATRYLAELVPSEGIDAVRKVPPHSLDMPCGTGQSDDRFRELKYQLPGRYRELTLVATASGTVDPETMTNVQVIADDRFDQQDRQRTVAQRTFPLGSRQTLTADITGVDTLTLHIECDEPEVTVRFEDPRLLR
jgi:hypothetical protein